MKRSHWILACVALATQAALGTLSAQGQTRLAQAPSAPFPGPTPAISPNQSQPQINTGSITGVTAAIKCINDSKLAAQADGLLQELLVEEGMMVQKGQLLLKIDERVALAEMAVAEKEAQAAEAQAGQDANLRYSKKVYDVSEAEYQETEDLLRRRSASLQETRRKKLEADKSKLGIEVAEVDHQKDVLAAQVAKEKLNAAKVQLDLRKVIAPYDGVIVERMRDQGEFVKSGEPILHIVHMDEMRVEANVPVRGISASQLKDAPIRLHVRINGEDVVRDAKIEYVSPILKMNTCRVWARVPNTMIGGAWMLQDSMEATLDITLNNGSGNSAAGGN